MAKDGGLLSRIAVIADLQGRLLGPILSHSGLTFSSFQLLAAAHASKGQSPQAEIADRLGISPGTLSEAVAEQVRLGLLTQEPLPKDKRARTLVLTPQGEAKIKQIRRMIDKVHSSLEADLDPASVAEATALLGQIEAKLKALTSEEAE